MLKSVEVSRHGPRSMATTFSPASVSCCARSAPVQPSPIITASFFGIKRAKSATQPVDRDRPLGIGDIVLADMVAIVVTRAGEADHLPARHVASRAIKRVVETALHGVLQHQLEKFLGAEAGLELE